MCNYITIQQYPFFSGTVEYNYSALRIVPHSTQTYPKACPRGVDHLVAPPFGSPGYSGSRSAPCGYSSFRVAPPGDGSPDYSILRGAPPSYAASVLQQLPIIVLIRHRQEPENVGKESQLV